ncbi:monofunctional biosynthetic peptidoglycan transglycosylase [Formosa agariphila KMM 3901]|uniref:Biosynthetic peptidoglycan transglycosylase n=1 Tax=Formosa agariphila (strain DSM 15362 / KCTC 12365 / LMG 23005 / KMM 3901 / M-2Alg 35-1) TaxID=1347342 RepID=T2KIE3_FORAG|nr:monofunctional biosynthetic peptidoglycan transglycosylase [Formosa agariphila]CDF77744.1 monofunctional biosynthetic peptidoglycan transglycosylase [Formosa agariphila KMM 3901]
MKKIFRFLFKILIWFILVSTLIVVIYKFIPVPITPLMLIRSFETSETNVPKTWSHEWVDLDTISIAMQKAVICSEDQNFLNHNGFDFKAIEKAISSNQKGKRLRGGSTISQQTAKNVFLWPGRSWFRKGLEVYFTVLIEVIWSKSRILEVYLNSIEMGNNIYGCEAAAQFWFNTSAKKLSNYEAAAIASILPNPRVYKANPASAYIQKRKAWIVKQMNYFGPLRFETHEN